MDSPSGQISPPVAKKRHAECPFNITIHTNPSHVKRDRHQPKRQKRDETDDGGEIMFQKSPFSPTGGFRTHETMDFCYTMEPSAEWREMTPYNSFVLNGTKHHREQFVYVANDASVERQVATAPGENGSQFRKAEDDWVALILEIRAADEHHVYARVIWMYSPDDLPKGTLDGKKRVEGRQPYHGKNELIASNHMDVINVVSVTMPAKVNQWTETDDDEIQDAWYWRQAFDCRNLQLSATELFCRCGAPANPDKTMIECTNSAGCGKWLHYECLEEDVLNRIFERLGQDKPHTSEDGVVRGEPTKATETPVSGPTTSALDAVKATTEKGKKTRRRSKADSKPYQGLFEATLKMDDGPFVWEIKDLRPGMTGGDHTWTEKAKCLCCGAEID